MTHDDLKRHLESCPSCRKNLVYCLEAHAIHDALDEEERIRLHIESIERDMSEKHLGFLMDVETFDPQWLTAREAAMALAGLLPHDPRWRDGGLHLLAVVVRPDAPREVRVAEHTRMIQDWRKHNKFYLYRGTEKITDEQAVELLVSCWCRWLTLAPPPWRAMKEGEDPMEGTRSLLAQMQRQEREGVAVIFFTAEDGEPTAEQIATVLAMKQAEHGVAQGGED
jgi:hypothetical protein